MTTTSVPSRISPWAVYAVFTVAGSRHLVPVRAEHGGNHVSGVLVVVHEQDARGHRHSFVLGCWRSVANESRENGRVFTLR